MSKVKRRVKWTPEEDARLQYSVEMHGSSNWVLVASELTEWNRTSKQCRERWVNHLAPHVQHVSWSADEDMRLLNVVRQYGSQWAWIASHFPGRSPNSLKNRWRTLTDPRQRIKLKGISNIVEYYEKRSHLCPPKEKQRKKQLLPSIDEFPVPEGMDTSFLNDII